MLPIHDCLGRFLSSFTNSLPRGTVVNVTMESGDVTGLINIHVRQGKKTTSHQYNLLDITVHEPSEYGRKMANAVPTPLSREQLESRGSCCHNDCANCPY